LRQDRARLESLSSRLAALSPLTVLARGYSIVLDEHGHAVTRADSVSPGASVTLRLHEGTLGARVIERLGADGKASERDVPSNVETTDPDLTGGA
jgi:exodeoxyribonuclease VII large subunit